MKAYITGATGCIGRNLVDVLLKNNWEVTVLHRKNSDLSKLKDCNVKFSEVELTNLDSLRKGIDENADALFHIAANLSHWNVDYDKQCHENITGTKNLVQISIEKKIRRFIFTSTGAAAKYDPKSKIKSGYMTSKRKSELEVEEGIKQGLDAVILRLPIVFGKYDYNNYGKIFNELKKNKFKFSFPGKLIFANAEDIAVAHLGAYEKGIKGHYYFIGGEKATWYEVFLKITKLLNVNKPLKPFPTWTYYTISYMMLWMSYITKKEPLLTPELIYLVNGQDDDPDIKGFEEGIEKSKSIGYEPSTLDAGLEATYKWLLESNKI